VKKKVLALIIFSSIVLLVAYLLKDLIKRFILAPVLDTLKRGNILYEAVPQYFWWGIFILILVVVAIRSLLGGRRPKPIEVEILNEERTSRARLWSRWIEMSQRGDYSKWLLARHLADLASNVLVYQERQSPERIQNRIMSDDNVIPSGIRDYLRVGLNTPSFRHYTEYLGDKSWFHLLSHNRISQYVRGMLRRKDPMCDGSTLAAGSTLPHSPLQIDPEVIVHFLESKIPTGGSV
jgi:hypothetical protein